MSLGVYETAYDGVVLKALGLRGLNDRSDGVEEEEG
jgi:hypothetical protein